MTAIIGTPYDLLIDEIEDSGRKPSIRIKGRSLEADWESGYPDLLSALAKSIELPEVETDPNKVAIIGHFFERNEEDHRGNVRELERLVGSLNLETATTWLSGVPLAELARVAEAGTLVALPGGQAAAKILSKRTGAQVVETPLPMGWHATDRWVEAVAAATGREREAALLIEQQQKEILPRLKWVTLKRFIGSRWIYCGHPLYIPSVAEIAEFVGARVITAVAWSSREPDAKIFGKPSSDVQVLHALNKTNVHEVVAETTSGRDLLICNSELISNKKERLDSDIMEFGFPSWRHHALHDEPFLGYRGFASFLGRVTGHLDDRNYRTH